MGDSAVATGGSAGDEARKQRLAAALRDNLKRRKAQARARREPTSDAAKLPPEPLPGDDKP
ncbi:hypothetical protein GCM10007036_08220 [Alsobacter metallidurans]|uniref:Uncharacterized protein n=1 Tax=Alsobacter metallidurans TaxID=340221 RepID=A0A917I534_9HYPH|nr:hypothetical protein GCM10007036_08220 [Alsobacter metallidurans]